MQQVQVFNLVVAVMAAMAVRQVTVVQAETVALLEVAASADLLVQQV